MDKYKLVPVEPDAVMVETLLHYLDDGLKTALREAIAVVPCPFCGGDDITEYENDLCQLFISCNGCGAEVSNNDRKGKERWNRRATPAVSAEPVAWLCEHLDGRQRIEMPGFAYTQDAGFGHKRTPLYLHPPAPAVADTTPVIDLDELAWEGIKQAASESNWIPPEYYANDWQSDVCKFLREGVTPFIDETPAPAVAEWQYISTAPSDDYVLAANKHGEVFVAVREHGFWVNVWSDEHIDAPLYWQPLPTPPNGGV